MQEMKDDIWFGSLPEHWAVGRIGKLYTERKTKVSDVDYAPLSVTKMGVVPQLATAAKTDAHDDRKLVLKGDFAINSRSDRRGSCGISGYDGSVSLINTILTPREEMNPGYYNWLFHTAEFADEFYKWGHGIVDDLWTTNWSDMKRIAVPVPPLQTQQRIADFLDTKCAEIDSVLEKTRASIEEYKALKQSVITEAVTKGIRGERSMKDSGVEWIGVIPDDWIVSKIKFESSCNNSVLGENTPGNYCFDYIDIGSVEYGKGIIAKERLLFKDAPSRARREVKKNDIIISTVRTYLKAIAMIKETAMPIVVSTGFAVLSCNFRLLPTFLYYFALSDALVEYVIVYSNGIGYPSINSSDLINCKVPLPSLAEQEEIAAYLDEKCTAIDSLIASKEALITELESYKKSLIYEYVTGKKEVV